MRRLATISALLCLIPAAALANYDESRKEFDSYSPPGWLFKARQGKVSPAASPGVPTVPEPEVSRPAPFFTPDPARAAELEKIATDPGKTAEFLGARLELPDLEVLALRRSPRIAASEKEVAAAGENLGLSRSLTETLNAYAAFTDSSMPPAGGVMKEPDSYPYPGIASLRGTVAALESAVSAENLETEKAALLTDVRRTWWELCYVVRAKDIAESSLELLGSMEAAAGARYASGQGGMGEIASLNAEVEKSREDLATLKTLRRAKEDALLSLLALPPGTALAAPAPAADLPGTLPEVKALVARARLDNPALRAMRRDLARMDTMVAMSETMSYGRFDQNTTAFEDNITQSVGTSAMEPSFAPAPSASEGIGAPRRSWFSAEAGYIRQTKARREAARKALEAQEYAIDAQVSQGWFAFDQARRQEALYRQRVMEFSRLAFESNLAAYQSGKGAFAEALESYRSWLDASLMSARNMADMGSSLAELEKLTGKSPLSTGIGGLEQKK